MFRLILRCYQQCMRCLFMITSSIEYVINLWIFANMISENYHDKFECFSQWGWTPLFHRFEVRLYLYFYELSFMSFAHFFIGLLVLTSIFQELSLCTTYACYMNCKYFSKTNPNLKKDSDAHSDIKFQGGGFLESEAHV